MRVNSGPFRWYSLGRVIAHVFALLPLTIPVVLLAESVTITADQWASPRSGQAVARLGLLNKLVEAFDRSPQGQIIIRYAKGESGTLWAEELRSWLISLGIPSRRITLSADLGTNDIIVLETGP